jgi:DNA-binding SARP family transcriptional activator
MSDLKLFFFGPPRIESDGEALQIDTRKTLALVAYLAVTGEAHTRDSLATLLWPGPEPHRARSILRRNLSIMRKALEDDWLVVSRESIGIDPNAGVWLDVDHFRALLMTASTHGHPDGVLCEDCLSEMAEAVELYRGDFLEGYSLRDSPNFDDWQLFETESLRQELATALEMLARGHTARDEHEAAIPYARRWVALDPWHEPAHQHLMQLYARDGQRTATLRQYHQCVRVLEREMGLPLLQFALTLLWDQQAARTLTHDGCEAIGRVQGALARHTDEVYDALSLADQTAAQRIFLQLVRPVKGCHQALGLDETPTPR